MSQGCLIVDANSRIGYEVGRQLLQRGMSVWVHSRGEAVSADGMAFVAGDSPQVAVRETLAQHPEIGTVIFDLSTLNEQGLLEGGQSDLLCDQVETHSLEFLMAMQAALRQLITVRGAQVWVLVREDSFRYHLDVPAPPIMGQLRSSTVRTVAKEVARFGVRVNAAVLHYSTEELSPEIWRAGAGGLKSYAQKYKPFAVSDMAGHLVAMICNSNLPVHGAVMQLGCGVLENNI